MIARRTEKSASPRKMVKRQAHWIEWVTGILSTVLVVGMIIAVIHDGMIGMDGQPELSVSADAAKPVSQGFEVAFRVVNTGKRTASAVPVRATLRDGDAIIEEREMIFDYVPADSETTGAFLFRRNPADYALDVRPIGYQEP